MRRLRAPDGCPWDREQSPESLRPSLIEEAWEAISAIDTNDDPNLREELGDIYLVVTMISWMREEAGGFRVQDVLHEISEKLIRRHPHVFGDATASTPKEVLRQWDEIKTAEHAGSAPSVLDHIPRSLPPLERSLRVQKKAARIGFDWPSAQPVWEKIEEEMRELREELGPAGPRAQVEPDGRRRARIEEEAGDVLFSVVNLLRLLHVDPGIALHRANEKFERRFRAMEQLLAARGVKPSEEGLESLDKAWNEIKMSERTGPQRPDSATAQGPADGPDAEHKASK